MKRLIAAGCIASLASGCTIPRTALITGGTVAIAGGAIMMNREEPGECDAALPYPHCFVGGFVEAGSYAAATALGSALLLLATGLMTSGVIGLAQEKEKEREKPPAPPLALSSATPAGAMSPAARGQLAAQGGLLAAPGDQPALSRSQPAAPERLAAHERTRSRLALHIRLAARANRCAAAALMLDRLTTLDAELAHALVAGDEHVARCTARPSVADP